MSGEELFGRTPDGRIRKFYFRYEYYDQEEGEERILFGKGTYTGDRGDVPDDVIKHDPSCYTNECISESRLKEAIKLGLIEMMNGKVENLEARRVPLEVSAKNLGFIPFEQMLQGVP